MTIHNFKKDLMQLNKEVLVEMLSDAAKNWLAHDGLWFLEVEAENGMEKAIKYDTGAWKRFTVIEAKRIMNRQGIGENSGLEGLEKALKFRMYAFLNQMALERKGNSLTLFMKKCRVQNARQRDGRPDFPCKSVGEVEYAYFATTIDSRIKTRCICCPPDAHPVDYFCGWEFTI